jgi:hypothetical protein
MEPPSGCEQADSRERPAVFLWALRKVDIAKKHPAMPNFILTIDRNAAI